jgi:uncharacterized membrane protein
MSLLKVIAIILIIGGILGLAYGSFTYPKETHEAKIGPVEVKVNENKTVNIPVWVGVSSIVLGGVLFMVGCKSCKK